MAAGQASTVLHDAIEGVEHLGLSTGHSLTQLTAVGGQVQHEWELYLAAHLTKAEPNLREKV